MNLRTLMARVSASVETYDRRTTLRLRGGKWGNAIFAAKDVLRKGGVDVAKWVGGEYEDFLGVA